MKPLIALLAILFVSLVPTPDLGEGTLGCGSGTFSATAATPQKRSSRKSATKTAAKKSTAKKTTTKKRTTRKRTTKKANNSAATGTASKKATGPRTSASVRAEKEANARRLKEAQRKLRLNTAETEKRLNQLALVEGEIDVCDSRIAQLSAKNDSLRRLIRHVNDSINYLDNRLAAITSSYAKALRHSQARRQNTSDLAFIFASESFTQAYRRLGSLRQFDRWRQRKTGEIRDLRTLLDAQQQQLTTLSDKASRALTALGDERQTLGRKQGETTLLVDHLKTEGAELQQIMERRTRQAQALDDELERIIAAEAERAAREAAEKVAREKAEREAAELAAQKAAAEKAAQAGQQAGQQTVADKGATKASGKKVKPVKRRTKDDKAKKGQTPQKESQTLAQNAPGSTPAPNLHTTARGTKLASETSGGGGTTTATAGGGSATRGTAGGGTAAGSADFASLQGRLPYPIQGRYTIVKRFGRQKHPTLPHVETNNSGIDIETASGATALAVADGEVSAIFRPDGYNSVVVVRHPDQYLTVYANLGHVAVSNGQKLRAGTALGTIFADPHDNGRSVLHFELRHARTKENPEVWLKK